MVKRKKKTTSEISDISCKAVRQKLPDGLKAKFGSIGFVKWTCAYCPVLIVDPMKMVLSQSIPEGIYNAWMHQVHLHSSIDDEEDDDNNEDTGGDDDSALEEERGKESEEASIQMLPVLVYWYGTSYEFSIVRLSQIIPWEDGCQKGYNILPPFMSRRIQKLRRPVPAVYSLLEDALLKVEVDGLPHPPEGRSLAIFPPGNKKKNSVVLNEWHALAMEAPPQEHSWMEQKQLIEPALPHSEWFGQIAFLSNKCGSLDYHHPVLIMHPFRVPPNQRTEWFNKCSSGKLVMVYWMGSYTSGRIQQHVFTCHPLNDLVPYEEGVKKRYDKVPKQVIHDYGNTMVGAKRMAQVDFWVCGTLWELPRALEREPQDRWGGLEDFEEDHDDDFDYFWECLNAAKEAQEAQQRETKNNNKKKKNGSIGSSKKRASSSSKMRRKRNALDDDTDDDHDDLSHEDDHDHDDDSNQEDDNLGLFDDSSEDGNHNDKEDDEKEESLRQRKKRKISEKKSKSDDKERKKPTHAKRLESSARRTGKFPLREGEKRDQGNNGGDKERNGTKHSSSSPSSLHEDLDHAVRRSLSHVAAMLNDATADPRPVNPKSTPDSNHRHAPDFLPRMTNGGTNTKSSDFMRELSRQRQAATEKIVNDVIEQWTQVRHAKK